jgi:hypothetical protein
MDWSRSSRRAVFDTTATLDGRRRYLRGFVTRTLDTAILDAIMEALDAHQTMSRQTLDSDKVRAGLKSILLGLAELHEALRGRGVSDPAPRP